MSKKTISSDCVPVDWVRDFKGYNSPSCNDTAVVMCYFSACRFNLPMQNALAVHQDLKQASIPCFLIELCYPNQNIAMSNPDLVVHSKSYMFHKENLFNLMAKQLDKKYEKIIFLDSDVRFSNPNWFDLSSQELDECDVIQPMEKSYWSNKHNKHSVANYIANNQVPNLSYCHPGFAFGVRRNWLEKIEGLFEEAIIGAGDISFWSAVSASKQLEINENHMKIYTSRYKNLFSYVEKVKNYCPRVGYVRECLAGHLPHGTWKNRNYAKRQELLSDDIEIFKNEQGVFEWSDVSNNDKVYSYFKSRDEDNLFN